MEYFDLINKRYSCREYTDEKIKKEELNKILEASNLAPTAVNFQPQKILVIENPETLEKLKEGTKYTFNSKTILCVIHDTNVSWHRYRDQRDFGSFDSAIVTTYIVLAATNLNIGSCIVCSMDDKKVREILNISDNYVIDSLITLGYPKNESKINSRKNLDEIVEYR